MGVSSSYKATITSYLAGLLFGGCWWLFVDAAIVSAAAPPHYQWFMYCPGIIASLALIMINSVAWSEIGAGGDSIWGDSSDGQLARGFLFSSMIVAFSSVIWSIYLFATKWGTGNVSNVYPGLALIIQTSGILMASFLYFFGRKPDDE